jgi:hypothetical protein
VVMGCGPAVADARGMRRPFHGDERRGVGSVFTTVLAGDQADSRAQWRTDTLSFVRPPAARMNGQRASPGEMS